MKKKSIILGVMLFSLSFTVFAETAYPSGKWQPGPPKYGFKIVNDVQIKMDDGAVLNASIAYPTDLMTAEKAKGKFPVVIEHTPYVQFSVPVEPNTYFTEHGYISVMLTARGGGKSTGEVDNSGSRDAKDGKAVVQWAAYELEGSDGRVGMVGCSWPGMLALDTAGHIGKKSPLKAIVAACSGFEAIHR